MTKPITFFCVLKSGGVYGPEHVGYLKHSLEQSVSPPFRLVCLSDVAVPCERVTLQENWPGFWSKIELFRPGVADPAGLNIYLDLDVLVTGRLDPLLAYDHRFTMVRDDGHPDRANSSVMIWTGDHSRIYRAMLRRPGLFQRSFRRPPWFGDQALIEQHLQRRGTPAERLDDIYGQRAMRIFRRAGDIDDLSEAMFLSFQGCFDPKPGTARFDRLTRRPGTSEARIAPLLRQQWGLAASDQTEKTHCAGIRGWLPGCGNRNSKLVP